MNAQVKAPDPLTLMDARAFLESLSERQRVQFREANVRIGNGRTVHAATTIEWYGGVPLVVPACRVGISGWWLDRLHPSYGPVTCGRAACRASAGAPRWAPRHASVRVPVQQSLFTVQGQAPRVSGPDEIERFERIRSGRTEPVNYQ